MALENGVNSAPKTPLKSVKTALKSVAPANPHQTPVKSGSIRPITFDGLNGPETATVDLNLYTFKAIRAHNRAVDATSELPDADQEDAISDLGLKLALLGTVECSAFADLTIDGLLEENYNVVQNYVVAVKSVVFPTSPKPAVEA